MLLQAPVRGMWEGGGAGGWRGDIIYPVYTVSKIVVYY